MIRPHLRALAFARRWSAPRTDLREIEVTFPVGPSGAVARGTLASRPGSSPRTGWVVLHGLTRPGRKHPALLRFVRALASVGGRVLVPEVPAWTELRFEPEGARDIVEGAVRWLSGSEASRPGGVILVGFSFGGPQTLLAASDPDVSGRLRGVVSWGGYESLDRTVAFQFTGRHALDGAEERIRPDPYGRWVVGANCLVHTPEYRDRSKVADALHRLAVEAGERQLPPLDPGLDPLKEVLGESLAGRDRELFDLFAPPWDRDPDPELGRAVAQAMVEAAREVMPLLDPVPAIERLVVPVRLLHGRSDRLIPYTETLHLARTLEPRTTDLDATVTGLFAHSGGAGRIPLLAGVREGAGFLRMLASVLELDR